MNDFLYFFILLEEHLQSFHVVFAKLWEATLKLQLGKCGFLKQETLLEMDLNLTPKKPKEVNALMWELVRVRILAVVIGIKSSIPLHSSPD